MATYATVSRKIFTAIDELKELDVVNLHPDQRMILEAQILETLQHKLFTVLWGFGQDDYRKFTEELDQCQTRLEAYNLVEAYVRVLKIHEHSQLYMFLYSALEVKLNSLRIIL